MVISCLLIYTYSSTGLSNITTVPDSTIPFTTINVTSSATSYPFGAVISVKTYVPSARFLILCTSSVEIQLSITTPSFVNSSLAPGSSFFVVISCLLIKTNLSAGFSIGLSNIITVPVSTTPSFTSNVTSSATSYPFGAVISVKTYIPSARFLILCTSLVEVQLSMTTPSFVNSSFAPGSSFFVVISCLLIKTNLSAGFSIGLSNITISSLETIPSTTVNVMDSAIS